MKRTKKLLVALLTTLLALPLFCATALAEDPTYTFVVTNKNATSSTGDYEYLLYQMFTGDIADNPSKTGEDDKYILSNIAWGQSVPETTQAAMYDMFELEGTNRTAANVAERITATAANNSNVFHDMMTYMAREKQKTNGESLTTYKTLAYSTYTLNNTTIVTGWGATGLPAGYYLVRNTKVPESVNTTNSDYIVKVVGEDRSAEVKASTISLQKKTQNINDSLETVAGSLRDTADYDIGDDVPFTLTTTLPENYANFNKFKLIFEDDMSAGLTLNADSVKVQFGNIKTETATFVQVNPNEEVTVDGVTRKFSSQYPGGTLWKLQYDDLKARNDLTNLQGGDIITVTYTAKLNSSSAVTSAGNPNRYRVIFSNRPSEAEEYLTSSTYDTNVVFTYKTIFNKVDQNNQPLAGADFMLEKFIINGTGGDKATINGTEYSGVWTDVTILNDTTHPTKTGTTSDTSFIFSGLDDGHYRLTESTTPTGYNTIAPQEFDIVATHSEGDDPKLLTLTGTGSNDFTMTSDVTNATLSVNIQNKKGTVLPTTGGTGTTALYVVGGLLLGGSVVAFIVKRRMHE